MRIVDEAPDMPDTPEDNVVPFSGLTCLDIPADRVLSGALKEGLKSVVVCGLTEDGDEYFASSMADGADTLWALERAKYKLLKIVDDLVGDD